MTPPSPAADGLAAALLDSGGVLMRPIGGRWNPRPDFDEKVLARAPHLTADQLLAAIAAGDQWMTALSTTPHYGDYLRVVLRHLGVPATPSLLAELQRPLEPATFLETFPEVPATLRELRRRRVRMAVVSDAGAGLPGLHAALGIDEFFEAYAISQVLGCNKPDPRMYHHASGALGLAPAQCLFVDDDPDLVAAAIELGYAGRAICRDGRPPADGTPFITSLDELPELFT